MAFSKQNYTVAAPLMFFFLYTYISYLFKLQMQLSMLASKYSKCSLWAPPRWWGYQGQCVFLLANKVKENTLKKVNVVLKAVSITLSVWVTAFPHRPRCRRPCSSFWFVSWRILIALCTARHLIRRYHSGWKWPRTAAVTQTWRLWSDTEQQEEILTSFFSCWLFVFLMRVCPLLPDTYIFPSEFLTYTEANMAHPTKASQKYQKYLRKLKWASF